MFFSFDCEHCDAPTYYLLDATEKVLCGTCQNFGSSVALTDEQVAELDLPVSDMSFVLPD